MTYAYDCFPIKDQSVEAVVKDPNLPLYRNVSAVTEKLFRVIKVEVGSRAQYLHSLRPHPSGFGSGPGQDGFIVISDIPIQMTKAWEKGRGLFAVDNTHCNEEGNKIVGDLVARAVNDWFPSQSEGR